MKAKKKATARGSAKRSARRKPRVARKSRPKVVAKPSRPPRPRAGRKAKKKAVVAKSGRPTRRRTGPKPRVGGRKGRLAQLKIEAKRAGWASWIRGEPDERAVLDGCTFDAVAADRPVEFFRRFLRHFKGVWAGQPFEMMPWQADDVVRPLFGWKRADGSRRYRRGYIQVPKKNGKTTMAAGLTLYMLVGDGEPGAEIYSAANDRNQAAIIFRDCHAMARASSALTQRLIFTPSQKNIAYPEANSFYKALSADVPTKEGLNAHAIIIDELHAARSRQLFDTLRYAGAARAQPLTLSITTAGDDKESICYEEYQYASSVLDGTIPDSAFFAYVMEPAEDDDWTDPAVWARVNPSLGVTIRADEMGEACAEATQSPRKQSSFKRYRLNIWLERISAWLLMENWDRCAGPVDPDEMLGRECWAGLDLASTTDIAALMLLFPDDGRYVLLPFFWIPEENAIKRARRDRVPYDLWTREGLITATEGNVIDYDQIRARINSLGERYNIREIAIDRWNATQITTQLTGDGFTVVPFGQGFASMSAPTKELERLVLAGALAHGGHPVLRWMASNVSIETDAAGNVKPSKRRSREKIDGIVGTIMALGRAILKPEAADSVYESRGVLTV